jgi:hypothetical protein
MYRLNRLVRMFVLISATFAAMWMGAASPSSAQADASGTISPIDEAPASAQVVNVGMYVNTVYQLEVASSTYYLDAYLWFKWKGDIDPTATMEITNLVEEWGAMITALNEEPMLLPDGYQYKLLKVEGRFMQPFVLADYPLDQQKLSVYLEDNTYGSDQLVYVMDTEGSGYGHMLAIPGWQINNWSSQQLVHDYGSFFGAEKAGSASVYSTLRFDLEIARPVNFFIWKLMLPLVILLMASWMILVLNPKLIEVRTALPATGLLTAVFLQQSYSDGLPEVGYLVLIDKVYAVAYAMILLTLLRAIWTSRTELESASAIATARSTDRKLLVSQIALFIVAVAAIIVAR